MAKKKTEEIITGVFQGTSRGFGFLVPEDGKSREDDYFIPPRATGGAWDGDKVQASPDPEIPWEEGRGQGPGIPRSGDPLGGGTAHCHRGTGHRAGQPVRHRHGGEAGPGALDAA